jgi:Sel1 repeat
VGQLLILILLKCLNKEGKMKKILASLFFIFTPQIVNAQAIVQVAAPSQEALWEADNIYYKTLMLPVGERDWQKVIDAYQKSADLGHPDAFSKLGTIYYGYVKDMQKAREYYKLGAQNGSTEGQLYYGILLMNDNPPDCQQAMKYFEESASHGLLKAIKQMGSLYSSGKCVEKDTKKSLEYFVQSANRGDTYSQILYANALYSGKDIDANPALAAAYYYLAGKSTGVTKTDNIDQAATLKVAQDITNSYYKLGHKKIVYKHLENLCNTTSACNYTPNEIFKAIKSGQLSKENGIIPK